MDTLLMPALGVPLDAAGRADRGQPDGRCGHRHGQLPASQRHAAHAARRGRARRGRRAAVGYARRLYRTKPNRQLKLFGLVLARLERDSTAGSCGPRCGMPTTPPPARPSPTRRASATCSASRPAAEIVSCSARPARRPSSASARARAAPDATVLTGTFGGGGHARAAGATVGLPIDEAHAARARRGAPAMAEQQPGWSERRSTASSSSPRTAGPTSHDIVALVRRLTGVKRVGHGGTLDPFAAGVLPVFVGHATRLVEYHLGDDKEYRAIGVLRRALDDRRSRG